MMRSQSIVVAAIVLGLVEGAAGSGGNPEAKNLKNPSVASAASVAAGEALFQKTCRFCHGSSGKGDAPTAPKGTADLTDAQWDHGSSDGEIFVVIRDGAGPDSKMKGFKGRLSDDDMWNLVNYVRTLNVRHSATR